MTVASKDVLKLINDIRVQEGDQPQDYKTEVDLTDQGFDSLAHTNLMFEITEKYHVEIPDSEYDNLVTIDKITSFLNDKGGKL